MCSVLSVVCCVLCVVLFGLCCSLCVVDSAFFVVVWLLFAVGVCVCVLFYICCALCAVLIVCWLLSF